MNVQVVCPHSDCGQKYAVADSLVGRAKLCKRCGRAFVLAVDQTVVPGADANTMGSSAAAEKLTDGAESAPNLGRFAIRTRLGAGAFGVVYRAYDPLLEREVALKVPRAGALQNSEARARFLREPKVAAQLRHPHIVPIYDAGQDGDRYYIASAFIEGRTLANALRNKRPDFREAAQIVRDLAQALDYAHRMGVIHRDVKPANIMIDQSGQALLMDFGLARLQDAEEKLTQDGTVMGTPAYMAPEQADRQYGEVGPASDQYSLGVVFYEMLCGTTPFTGPSTVLIAHLLNSAPEAPRKRESSISRDLETICLKALAKQPQDRYPTCGELAEDLRRWLADEPIRARRMNVGEQAWRWSRRNRVLAVLAAVSLVLAVVSSSSAVRLFFLRQDLAKAVASEQHQAQLAHAHTQKVRDNKHLAERKERAAAERERAAKEALSKLQAAIENRKAAETAQKAENENRAEAEQALQLQEVKATELEQARQDQEKAAKDTLAKKQAEEVASRTTTAIFDHSAAQSEWQTYTQLLVEADRAIQAGKVDEAIAALDGCPTAHRAWEWGYLWARCQGMKPIEQFSVNDALAERLNIRETEKRTNKALPPWTYKSAREVNQRPRLSPDGNYVCAGTNLARAGAQGWTKLATSDELGPGPTFFAGKYYSPFNRDAAVAYVCSDGAVYRYSLSGKTRIQIENALDGDVPTAACFDFAGELIVVSCRFDEQLKVYHVRVAKAKSLKTPNNSSDWRFDVTVPAAVTVSPEVATSAAATRNRLRPAAADPNSICRSCDFLIADEGRKVLLWLGACVCVCEVGATAPLCVLPNAISISPDGRRVLCSRRTNEVSNSGTSLVGLCDSHTGVELPDLLSLSWCRTPTEILARYVGSDSSLSRAFTANRDYSVTMSSSSLDISTDWTKVMRTYRVWGAFPIPGKGWHDANCHYVWTITNPLEDDGAK